jgi:pyridoxamine 5'-phosphate oxidase
MPFHQTREWLKKEKELGVEQSDCAVLSTVTSEGIPHSRVVAIREIAEDNLVFFTQQKTRKVAELLNNPHVSMNFLLAMQQRQIILEGIAKPLSFEENQAFWETLPRERQLRFSAYAATSGQPIHDLSVLDEKKKVLMEKFLDISIPMSEFYCGFRFIPETFIFYTVGSVSFSEVVKYMKKKEGWEQQLLSP